MEDKTYNMTITFTSFVHSEYINVVNLYLAHKTHSFQAWFIENTPK